MGYFPLPPGPKIISAKSVYKKKYAFIPVRCMTGFVWLAPFYKKYIENTYTFGNTREYFQCNLSQEDCIIDILSDAH